MSCICCGTKDSRIRSYKLHHTPPWLLSFFFAIQHILVLASMVCTCHYLLQQVRPLHPADQGRLLSSSLFACGFATALQSSMGTSLAIRWTTYLCCQSILSKETLPPGLRPLCWKSD